MRSDDQEGRIRPHDGVDSPSGSRDSGLLEPRSLSTNHTLSLTIYKVIVFVHQGCNPGQASLAGIGGQSPPLFVAAGGNSEATLIVEDIGFANQVHQGHSRRERR